MHDNVHLLLEKEKPLSLYVINLLKTMPYQNKVDPWGNIRAVKSRGMFLGNRGVLHNENQEIIATHRIKGWVTCLLEFKGRKREIMTPNRYTELFFLDEATAFSAGHRPCAECRRSKYNAFKEKWLEANQELLEGNKPNAANIDKIIHEERINNKKKVTYVSALKSLPNGTMVEINSSTFLIWANRLYEWSYLGYSKPEIEYNLNDEVSVLTPKSYVNTFSKGFIPEVHESIQKS